MSVLEQIFTEAEYGQAAPTVAKEYARDLHNVVMMLHDLECSGDAYINDGKYGAVEYSVEDYELIPDMWDLEELAGTPLAETSWESPGVLTFTITPQGELALEAYRSLDEDEKP